VGSIASTAKKQKAHFMFEKKKHHAINGRET
jgi:hypothetical protein